MFTSEIRVGRLYELRLREVESEQMVAAMGQRGRELMSGMGMGRAVVVADFREISFVRADLVDHLIQVTSRVNDVIERSGLLIDGSNAIFNLQVKRMVRTAGSPHRRVFQDALELQAWLGEVLTPPERERLAAFIAEMKPPARPTGAR